MGATTKGQASPPCRLLVADHRPDFALSLEHLLRREGYEVRVVYEGRQTLAAIRDDPPALALLDSALPGMSGFAVCQAVRADPALAGVRMLVLLLGAGSGTAEARKALALGADACLVKPFATAALLREVARVLQHVP